MKWTKSSRKILKILLFIIGHLLRNHFLTLDFDFWLKNSILEMVYFRDLFFLCDFLWSRLSFLKNTCTTAWNCKTQRLKQTMERKMNVFVGCMWLFVIQPLYSSACCISQVLEGKPIYADCFGNLVPLTKSGQHHLFSFFAFKENRLALFIKVSTILYLYFTKNPATQSTIIYHIQLLCSPITLIFPDDWLMLNCLAVADQRQHSGAMWPSVLYERT